jgi:phosphoglycerate dehydrogenase-like enzyme
MNRLLVLTPGAGEYLRTLEQYCLPDLQISFCEEGAGAPQAIRDCNLVLGRPTLVAPVLDVAEKLAWVQSTWAGVEPFCVPGLRRDYRLTGVKEVFSPSMSEFVFAYLLALERSLFELRRFQEQRHWQHIPYRKLDGLVMGLVGLGSIGEHIAATAHHFGLRVLAYKRTPGENRSVEKIYSGDELQEFLGQVDYLVLSLPGTPDTRGWLDLAKLKLLKPSAVIINIGRGSAVVEADLAVALRSGLIRAAVLDVFEVEPLPHESPLWELPNAYVSPHHAAYSFPEDIVRIFVENYRRFIEGKPLQYLIDFERGY